MSSSVKWILWTVLMAGFVLGPAREVGAQNDRYGIHTYYLDSYLAAKSRELGAGYVRIQIDWDSVQPDGPGDWNDDYFLNWLSNARANHLKLYATLASTPGWAGPCARPAPANCSNSSASPPPTATATRRSCPAASSSGWASLAPSPPILRCC